MFDRFGSVLFGFTTWQNNLVNCTNLKFDDVVKSTIKFRVRFHSSAFLTREESREGGFDGD